MALFDFIGELLNLALPGQDNATKGRPKIYILFVILIIPSAVWFLIELHAIFNLAWPFLFLFIASIVGVALSIGTISLIYRLELIEELNTKDILTVIIPVTLLTVSLASLLFRIF